MLREDLIAAGMSGLWDAIRRNPDGPSDSFEWYVRVRIRGAILDELRTQDWLSRRARAIAEESIGTEDHAPPPAVIRFDDVSEREQSRALAEPCTAETIAIRRESLAAVEAAINRLPKRDRYVISQHYLRGVKFKAIGKKLGVSEPRISQIHALAVAKLRHELTGAPMPPKRKR